MSDFAHHLLVDKPELLHDVAQWFCPSREPDRDVPCTRFYGFAQKYGELTSYYPAAFREDEIEYPSLEHYYQSKKFEGTPLEAEILLTPTSEEAAKLGNLRSGTFKLREDWDEGAADVMRRGARAKFEQCEHAREVLLSTGNSLLLFEDRSTATWGIGPDGTGRNLLGVVLMEVRHELRLHGLVQRLRQSCHRFHAPIAYITTCAGTPIATAVTHVRPEVKDRSLDGAADVWITHLHVVPEHRGRGVGSALVRKVVEEAARLRLGRLAAIIPEEAVAAAERAGWEAGLRCGAGVLVGVGESPTDTAIGEAQHCYEPPPPTRAAMLAAAVVESPAVSLLPAADLKRRQSAVAPAEDVVRRLRQLAQHPRGGAPEHCHAIGFIRDAARSAANSVRNIYDSRLSVEDISHVPVAYVLTKLDTVLSLASVDHAMKRMDHTVQALQVELDQRAHEEHTRGLPDQETYLAPSSAATATGQLDFLRRGAAHGIVQRVLDERHRLESTALRDAQSRLELREKQIAAQLEQLEVLDKMDQVQIALSDLVRCRECDRTETERATAGMMEGLRAVRADQAVLSGVEKSVEEAHAAAAAAALQFAAESREVSDACEDVEQELREQCALWKAEIERLQAAVAHHEDVLIPRVRRQRERVLRRRDRQAELETVRAADLAAFRQRACQLKDRLELGEHSHELRLGYARLLSGLVTCGADIVAGSVDVTHKEVADRRTNTHLRLNDTFTAFQTALAQLICLNKGFIHDLTNASALLKEAMEDCPVFEDARRQYASTVLEVGDMVGEVEGRVKVLEERALDTTDRIWEPTRRYLNASKLPFTAPADAVRVHMRRRGGIYDSDAKMPKRRASGVGSRVPQPPAPERPPLRPGLRWSADADDPVATP